MGGRAGLFFCIYGRLCLGFLSFYVTINNIKALVVEFREKLIFLAHVHVCFLRYSTGLSTYLNC